MSIQAHVVGLALCCLTLPLHVGALHFLVHLDLDGL